MNTLFFFYTIAMLIICVMTAVLAFAAWASTRRRLFLYSCGAYICYTIEITEIFFFEYISQNQPFPMEDYYAVSMPLARTIVTVVLHAFVWLIILDALDKHSKGLFFGPMVAFIAGNIFVLTVVPEGPMRQWLYYTLRQVFSLATLAYGVWCYRNQADTDMRARLARLKKPVIAAFALLLLIVAEDTWVILLSPPSDAIEWLPLYLSERNFTENILLIVAAVVLMVTIYHVLSVQDPGGAQHRKRQRPGAPHRRHHAPLPQGAWSFRARGRGAALGGHEEDQSRDRLRAGPRRGHHQISRAQPDGEDRRLLP